MRKGVPMNDARFGNFSEGEADALQAVEGVGLGQGFLVGK